MRTSTKRTPTKYPGVFYKDIISDSDKVTDKVYIIRYVDEDGKERQKKIGTDKEGIRADYCKKIRDEIITKIRLGEDLPHIARKKELLYFDTIAEKYFEYKATRVKDVNKEKARYSNHIKKHIGGKIVNNITIEDIEKLQHQYQKVFAPSTVNHLIFLISTIFKYSIKKQIFKGLNPASSVDGVKVDNKRERYLTIEEVNKLLAMSKQNNFEVWLFVKLSLMTGARVGTIMSIKSKDINIDNNSVTLKDHKSTKTYTGFYDDELKEILSNRVNELKPNDSILKHHRITIEAKLRAILDLLFNMELESDDRKHRVVIHTLRHTFASHLAIQGKDILTIKNLLNHKTIDMTMRYAHLSPNQGKKAVKRLYEKKNLEV